jgi:hypothetical protein
MAVRKGRVAAFVALARALRASGRPGSPGIGAQLSAVPRMLKLGLSGRYPGLSKGRILLALLGVLYIVAPVDLVPEVFFASSASATTRSSRLGSRSAARRDGRVPPLGRRRLQARRDGEVIR